MIRHFSSFELDVHFAEPRADVAEHVATCADCAAYLRELEALASEQPWLGAGPSLPSVANAHEASMSSPRLPAPRRTHLRLLAPVAGALALAAALALYVRSQPVDDAAYVGAKGAPAVQLLVRSGGTTRVWDGVSPVRPGDAIAIHVACEQLEQFAVATETPAGLARLAEGACPKTPAPLPFTLIVDDQPGREAFSVVLTSERLDDGQLRRHIHSATRDRNVWVTAFDFRKEPR